MLERISGAVVAPGNGVWAYLCHAPGGGSAGESLAKSMLGMSDGSACRGSDNRIDVVGQARCCGRTAKRRKAQCGADERVIFHFSVAGNRNNNYVR